MLEYDHNNQVLVPGYPDYNPEYILGVFSRVYNVPLRGRTWGDAR